MLCGRAQRWLRCTVGDHQSRLLSTAARLISVKKYAEQKKKPFFLFVCTFDIQHMSHFLHLALHLCPPRSSVPVAFDRMCHYWFPSVSQAILCTVDEHTCSPFTCPLKAFLLNEFHLVRCWFFSHTMIYFILSLPSSRDELRAPAEWLLPSPAAGAHGCVPAHEDAQEDSGTPVVRVLRHLRQDGTTHLHGNLCVCVCVYWPQLCVQGVL